MQTVQFHKLSVVSTNFIINCTVICMTTALFVNYTLFLRFNKKGGNDCNLIMPPLTSFSSVISLSHTQCKSQRFKESVFVYYYFFD